jgi:hypothetical protein
LNPFSTHKRLSSSVCWLSPALGLGQLANENSEGPLCGGRHNSIAKQSQLIGAIVCGDVQDGMVQPMGKPISVSTQRGLSLPATWVGRLNELLCDDGLVVLA